MRAFRDPFIGVAVVSLAAQVAGAQTPVASESIPALLQEVMKNHRRQANLLTEFTADRTVTNRDRNWRGVVEEETRVSEHYQSWNRSLDVVISVDGKVRSASKIQEDREEAGHYMEIDMKSRPETAGAEGPEYGSRKGKFSMSIFQIFRHAAFTNQRAEVFNGRPAIVLDFAPNPTLDHPPLPVDHLCGTVWIDATDRITAKLIAHMYPDTAKTEPVFVQAYERSSEGTWLGTYTRLNPSVKPEWFSDETFDWVIETRNYRRFGTEPADIKQVNRKR